MMWLARGDRNLLCGNARSAQSLTPGNHPADGESFRHPSARPAFRFDVVRLPGKGFERDRVLCFTPPSAEAARPAWWQPRPIADGAAGIAHHVRLAVWPCLSESSWW